MASTVTTSQAAASCPATTADQCPAVSTFATPSADAANAIDAAGATTIQRLPAAAVRRTNESTNAGGFGAHAADDGAAGISAIR